MLQWALWIIGLALQYLVLAALVAGPYKEFLALFAYCICLAVTTIAEMLIAMDAGTGSKLWKTFYWTADIVRQTSLYAAVISLVLHALPAGPKRGAMARQLILTAALFWIGSMWIHHDPVLGNWLSQVSRNLSFSSAVVNLILWFLLIASERRDNRLLLISGGLGIQMTGEAIALSLRHFRGPIPFWGSMFSIATHFLCLYIWWQALHMPADETGTEVTAQKVT